VRVHASTLAQERRDLVRIYAMAIECINPADLSTPESYSQVAVASAAGRLVFVAGQEPVDAADELVGRGDLGAQARQVFGNLGRALAAVGGKPSDVAKLTIFVANYEPSAIPVIEAARVEVFGDHKPADTLVGVATLSNPDFLIEVDAFAVIP
jgi:enamine deaminase RidA (YjgF/YER057c/UK114 family)